MVDDCVDLNYYKEAEATKADRLIKTADYEGFQLLQAQSLMTIYLGLS